MEPHQSPDTIVALATPPGRGGVAIVRVSGPAVAAIARRLLGRVPTPRYAHYLPVYDAEGEIIDQGIALYFPAPRSFTGEDVLEFQGHGGPLLMDMLQKRIIALGARPARPGEFSERAFLNNKLDLAQAEAIADLIESGTEQAARAAQRSLRGEFSTRINDLVEQLVQLRLYVESTIDFPEEEVDLLSGTGVSERLQNILEALNAVLAGARQGSLLREGARVVIAGRPNVGKSSLLNRMAGRDAAIVTDIPGTTRDVLRETIQIDGLPLHIFDTAGLRESAEPIEQEGLRRAWNELAHADRALLVVDDCVGLGEADRAIIKRLPGALAFTVVRNKIDLSLGAARIEEAATGTTVWLSAKTGVGLDLLRRHLKDSLGYRQVGEGAFSARRRHLDALQRAHQFLQDGRRQLQEQCAGELLAEDLRVAQNALSEITGAFTTEDLLGRIFASFCIGK